MLSVPPAMMAFAEPPLMRSAANAIACSPDAQNLFTVTADVSTGSPARRLAMRATFSPCSASGMAQPIITSSISDAATPGARFSASRITVAASSSGRVDRSDPFGAFPIGVRTAETISASAIEILKEIFDCVADLRNLAVEQMIGGVDDDKLLRLGQERVELANLFLRNQLVALAMNQKRRFTRRHDGRIVVFGHGTRDSDECAHFWIARANGHGHPGAERHASGPDRLHIRIARLHEREGGAKILLFAGPIRKGACASSHAAEIEPQHRHLDAGERLCRMKHRFRMHGPACCGERVCEYGDRARLAIGLCVDQPLE